MVLNKLITSFNNLFGISHWEENKKENDSGSPSFLGEEYSTSDMPILSFDEKESEEEKPKKQFGVSRPQKWDDFIGESYEEIKRQAKKARLKPTRPSSTGDNVLGRKKAGRWKKGLKKIGKLNIKTKGKKKRGKKGYGLGQSIVKNPWM